MLLVAVVVEVVIPLIVKLEVVFQVANGTGGAPVVAPEALQLEPAAKFKVATLPTKLIAVAPKFTIPVEATVTKVPVPPVVVIVFEVLPAKLTVPAINPVFPVPEKANATALAAWFKVSELPASTTKSSPGPPVTVSVLVVVPLD